MLRGRSCPSALIDSVARVGLRMPERTGAQKHEQDEEEADMCGFVRTL